VRSQDHSHFDGRNRLDSSPDLEGGAANAQPVGDHQPIPGTVAMLTRLSPLLQKTARFAIPTPIPESAEKLSLNL
jgi:hypothetical protein